VVAHGLKDAGTGDTICSPKAPICLSASPRTSRSSPRHRARPRQRRRSSTRLANWPTRTLPPYRRGCRDGPDHHPGMGELHLDIVVTACAASMAWTRIGPAPGGVRETWPRRPRPRRASSARSRTRSCSGRPRAGAPRPRAAATTSVCPGQGRVATGAPRIRHTASDSRCRAGRPPRPALRAGGLSFEDIEVSASVSNTGPTPPPGGQRAAVGEALRLASREAARVCLSRL